MEENLNKLKNNFENEVEKKEEDILDFLSENLKGKVNIEELGNKIDGSIRNSHIKFKHGECEVKLPIALASLGVLIAIKKPKLFALSMGALLLTGGAVEVKIQDKIFSSKNLINIEVKEEGKYFEQKL